MALAHLCQVKPQLVIQLPLGGASIVHLWHMRPHLARLSNAADTGDPKGMDVVVQLSVSRSTLWTVVTAAAAASAAAAAAAAATSLVWSNSCLCCTLGLDPAAARGEQGLLVSSVLTGVLLSAYLCEKYTHTSVVESSSMYRLPSSMAASSPCSAGCRQL